MAAKSEIQIGLKYSRLTILEDAGQNIHKKSLVKCVCDCGKECTVILSRIKSGLTKSCGCYKTETTSERSRVDYTGLKNGRLLVLEDVGTKDGARIWKCQCDCGNICEVQGAFVKYGHTLSCGCLQIDNTRIANTTHGMSASSEYFRYHKMLNRCYNPEDHKYPTYGARDITVCDRWLDSFDNFLEDMGLCPEGLSLERKDVNGNYNPENCIWDTASEQAFNQRISKANTSGKTGVHYKNGNWIARIWKNNKVYLLGKFPTFEAAVEARRQAELDLYGYLKDGGNA